MNKSIQQEIIRNRIARNFPSATDLSKTSLGFLEEGGEFEKARRVNDRDRMLDALGDVAVFVFGAFEILGADGAEIIEKIVENNKTRSHASHH